MEPRSLPIPETATRRTTENGRCYPTRCEAGPRPRSNAVRLSPCLRANRRAALDFFKVGDLNGATIDAALAHRVLQLFHREEGPRGLGGVECVRDNDFVAIVDRAEHLLRAHPVFGLDRREAVVHLPPSVEVRYPVPDDSNGAHHDTPFL